ncbi:MAG: peptide chain release factor N(5)-glutamine methyltransferase [Rhodomicrobiaceae bacterium]
MPDLADRSWSVGSAGDATLQAIIALLAAEFGTAGLPTPELDARLIVLHACGVSREGYLLDPKRAVSREQAALIASYRRRRLAREPVSRIVGSREFWGRDFLIGPDVLDPRPETETLIETALDVLRQQGRLAEPLSLLDLGTGSGCILLTLLAELPQAWGIGVDRSLGAIEIARENARKLGVDSRSTFVLADWAEPFCGPFDLILSNPPYIRSEEIAGLAEDVRRYDPAFALDGGADGLNAYRRIATNSFDCASFQSWILLEAGQSQAKDITRIFHDAGWWSSVDDVRVDRDLAGINRVVAIKRHLAL